MNFEQIDSTSRTSKLSSTSWSRVRQLSPLEERSPSNPKAPPRMLFDSKAVRYSRPQDPVELYLSNRLDLIKFFDCWFLLRSGDKNFNLMCFCLRLRATILQAQKQLEIQLRAIQPPSFPLLLRFLLPSFVKSSS